MPGSMAKARAMATRCCWPPEKYSGFTWFSWDSNVAIGVFRGALKNQTLQSGHTSQAAKSQ
jgi:hypothetical protein